MVNFEFEIVRAVGVLSTSPSGWTKEINLVSWNGRTPKYEIRDWGPDHERIGKGITLAPEEWEKLIEVICSLEEKKNTGRNCLK